MNEQVEIARIVLAMTSDNITSAQEWLALPEVKPPKLRNVSESGTVHECAKVGFVRASGSQCINAGIDGNFEPDSHYVLPVASIVQRGGNVSMHRLPLTLGPWAYSAVALAQQGTKGYPAKVEFGNLDGRDYAEIL